MNFYGFQKMTLLDFPGKVACTVFTGGCNFRCPFCHNALLVTDLSNESLISSDEILRFLSKRKGLLDGIAITGGEPLLHKDLLPFLRDVRSLGFQIKLDTNGSFPELLSQIIDEHLADYIAMDVKNRKERYGETIGFPNFDLAPIEASMAALKLSSIDYEFRTTIVDEFHTVEDIRELANWITGVPHYYLQNFVDSGNLIGQNLHAVSKDTLKKMQVAASTFVPQTQIRGI